MIECEATKLPSVQVEKLRILTHNSTEFFFLVASENLLMAGCGDARERGWD